MEETYVSVDGPGEEADPLLLGEASGANRPADRSLDGVAWRVGLLGVACEFAWISGETTIIPYLTSLQVPLGWASLIFVVNPMVGILLHPWLARLSDSCLSTCGRRRPFIAGLSAVGILGLLTLASAESVCQSRTGLLLAIFCAYGSMDIVHDGLQVFGRLLLADLATDQAALEQASSSFIVWQLAGRLAALVLGALPLERLAAGVSHAHARVMFVLAAVVSAMCAGVVMRIPEAQTLQASVDPEAADEQRTGSARRLMPLAVLWGTILIGWSQMNEISFFWTSLIDESHKALGMRLGFVGMAAQASVGIGATMLMPAANSRFGIHWVYAATLLVLACCMVAAGLLPNQDDLAAIMLVAVTGVSYAALNSLPFEIAELLIRGLKLEESRGQYTGLVATSLPLAQILVGVFAGVAVEHSLDGRIDLLLMGTGLVSLLSLGLLGLLWVQYTTGDISSLLYRGSNGVVVAPESVKATAQTEHDADDEGDDTALL